MVCMTKKLFRKWKIIFIYSSLQWFTVVPVTYLPLFYMKSSFLWKSLYIIIINKQQQQEKYDAATKTENILDYIFLH